MTNEAAVAALQQNLDKARELFAKRLLPAKLKVDGDAGSKNGRVLKAWLVRKDLQQAIVSMSPQAICDEFYKAVVDDVQQPVPQLTWEVGKEPKALLKRAEQDKAPATRLSVEATNDLASRKRASEEADARIKEQEQAKRRCLGLIAAFTPTRRGVLRFSLRDEKQKVWRELVAKGGDFLAIEEAILKEQENIYAQLQRPEQV